MERGLKLSITGVGDNGREGVARERRYQRRYARRHGYFWLPCPLCGEEFGGHERGSGNVPTGDPDRFESICPACTAERQVRAEEILRRHELGGRRYGTRWGSSEAIGHRIGAAYSPGQPPLEEIDL